MDYTLAEYKAEEVTKKILPGLDLIYFDFLV